MKICFADNKIKKICRTQAAAQKATGAERARKLFIRLRQIRTAKSVDELRHIPGGYHPLTGDRDGTWACSLDANWRLIFTPTEDGHVQIAIIKEIVDYH